VWSKNAKLINLQDDQVTFRWRDSADGNQQKLMTIDAVEFIRRFLLHVLPRGFVKIRHFGESDRAATAPCSRSPACARVRGGCCGMQPIDPSTASDSCHRYGIHASGELRSGPRTERSATIEFMDRGRDLLFRSFESWTKGGRRQESEDPLLDAANCGWMIWLWCRVLAVSPASWRLRQR